MAELICGKHHYNGILIKTPCPICTIEEDTGTTSEDIIKELEPRIEAAEAHVEQYRPFLTAAMAYCENKVEYLRLKKEISKAAMSCERLGWDDEFDCPTGNTCFEMRIFTGPDDAEPLDQSEWCQYCLGGSVAVGRRRVLGLRMSGLAQKMYAEYRKLEVNP